MEFSVLYSRSLRFLAGKKHTWVKDLGSQWPFQVPDVMMAHVRGYRRPSRIVGWFLLNSETSHFPCFLHTVRFCRVRRLCLWTSQEADFSAGLNQPLLPSGLWGGPGTAGSGPRPRKLSFLAKIRANNSLFALKKNTGKQQFICTYFIRANYWKRITFPFFF